jgi:hypothetical protein
MNKASQNLQNKIEDKKNEAIKLRLVIEILKQKIENEQKKYLDWIEQHKEIEITYEPESEWSRNLEGEELKNAAIKLVEHRANLKKKSRRATGFQRVHRNLKNISADEFIKRVEEHRKNPRIKTQRLIFNPINVTYIDKPFLDKFWNCYRLAEQGNLRKEDLLTETDWKYYRYAFYTQACYNNGIRDCWNWDRLLRNSGVRNYLPTFRGNVTTLTSLVGQNPSPKPIKLFRDVDSLKSKIKKLTEELKSIKHVYSGVPG